MGKKYMIDGVNYPCFKNIHSVRQTNWFVIAMFWTVVYKIKYDAVDLRIRKNKRDGGENNG